MGETSWASSEATRRSMLANRSGKTAPELRLRRAAHALGLRYYVDKAVVPGLRCRADLVFPRHRIAVFVDGCFWHGCPTHYRQPHGVNASYWITKIEQNRQRDRANDAILTAADWQVVRIWEHEDMSEAARRLARLLGMTA